MSQICPLLTIPGAAIQAWPPLAFAWTVAVTSTLISLLLPSLPGIRSPSQNLEGSSNNENQIMVLLPTTTCPAASHCIQKKNQTTHSGLWGPCQPIQPHALLLSSHPGPLFPDGTKLISASGTFALAVSSPRMSLSCSFHSQLLIFQVSAHMSPLQTSNYKMSEFWGCNVQHGDYS